MARRGKRLNQADIAERLGVSVSTVSRALANEAGISLSVREDVRQLASSMGYRAKRSSGVALGGRRVAAFVPLGSATSGLSGFYFGIVEGMRAAAAMAGMDLDIRLINEHAFSLDALRRLIGANEPQGLLLAGVDVAEDIAEWCRAQAVPMVLVNGSDPQMRVSSVSPANFYGAYCATERLLKAGHRRIIHYTQRSRPTILQRRRGFEAAIAACDGAVGLVVNSLEVPRAQFAEKLVAGEYEATAIFVWNDIVAVQILEALNDADLTQKYALIGFDDLPIASLATPRLSTVHVDREAIGRAAIRLMRQRMEGDQSIQQLEIGVEMVEGDTVHSPV